MSGHARFLVADVLFVALCLAPAVGWPQDLPSRQSSPAPAPADRMDGSASFRYERYARPGAVGPNRLAVDVPLVAGGSPFTVAARPAATVDGREAWFAYGGLADLRLYDEHGREVAYLLVAPSPRAPDFLRARVLPVATTKRTSGFEADLGSIQLVDRFSVEGLKPPYLKRARLEGSGDRAHWTLLAPECTLFDLPDEHLSRQDVDFAAGEYRYLRLTWDDSSSARVPLPRGCRARRVAGDSPRQVLRAAVPFERRASEPGISRFRLALPAPRLPVAAIELSAGGGHLLRRARVTESRLEGGQMNPVDLGSAILRRAVREDVAAAELRIPIQPPREDHLDLVVEDGNNLPLELTGASLVFADLPWIYFEAPSATPVLARFGAPRLSAPRYDLEAMRPSLGRVRVAEATWGERLDLAPTEERSAEAAVPTSGGPIDATAFAHRRRIPAGPRGLTALRLDAAALADSRFSDIRIGTPAGRQVPYLVERLDEPLAVELAALRLEAIPDLDQWLSPARGTRSVYRLELPRGALPASRLVVGTAARVFSREVRLVAERDQPSPRGGRSFETLVSSAWQHAEPEGAAPPLSLVLPALTATGAWLVVEEGDNSRLPLGRPTLLLPAYRLRFFRDDDSDLALLYGNAGIDAPRYDLALLAPRLVSAPAREVWPERENAPAPGASRAITATRLFWAALIGAVVILVVLLARLVRA